MIPPPLCSAGDLSDQPRLLWFLARTFYVESDADWEAESHFIISLSRSWTNMSSSGWSFCTLTFTKVNPAWSFCHPGQNPNSLESHRRVSVLQSLSEDLWRLWNHQPLLLTSLLMLPDAQTCSTFAPWAWWMIFMVSGNTGEQIQRCSGSWTDWIMWGKRVRTWELCRREQRISELMHIRICWGNQLGNVCQTCKWTSMQFKQNLRWLRKLKMHFN